MVCFWGAGNVRFLNLSAVHKCVQFMSIHQAIHLQHMYFSICILYTNKKIKNENKNNIKQLLGLFVDSVNGPIN